MTRPRRPSTAEPNGPADIQAFLDAAARRRQQEADDALRRRRREIIQRVKDQVIGNWSSASHIIGAETKARALDEIERTLSARPVDELAEWELVAIAEAIREKHYRPVMEAQDESQRLADLQQAQMREVLEQQRPHEQARERQERRRAELVEYGTEFARTALRGVDDLAGHERHAIVCRVEGELAQTLRGSESKRQVEALVTDILDDEIRDLLDADDTDDDNDDDQYEADDDEGRWRLR